MLHSKWERFGAPNVVLVVCLLLALGSASAQQLTESALREMLLLEGYEITYQDQSGKVLTFEEFAAKIMAGMKVRSTKEPDTKSATLFIIESAEDSSNDFPLKAGDPVPDPIGKDRNGNPASIRVQSENYTLLSFFFSACVPCIKEIPVLNEYSVRHADTRVVGVTFDGFEETNEFIEKHGMQFTTISDAQDYIDKIGVKAYPLLILVGPGGTFLARKSGGIFGPDMKIQGLEKLEEWVENSKDES